MKKVKKMADGGMSGLGEMIGKTMPGYPEPSMPRPDKGGGGYGGGGGESATEGLGTVRQGASSIGNALGRASEAIGGGDGGGGPIRPLNPAYMKKGGKVTTTRMSTATRSKKSPNW